MHASTHTHTHTHMQAHTYTHTYTQIFYHDTCPTNYTEESNFRTTNGTCAIFVGQSLQFYILICAYPSKCSLPNTLPDKRFVSSLHFCNSFYRPVHISLIHYLFAIMLGAKEQIFISTLCYFLNPAINSFHLHPHKLLKTFVTALNL